MEDPKCGKCGSEMNLEEERSYYADPTYEWICTNPECEGEEE